MYQEGRRLSHLTAVTGRFITEIVLQVSQCRPQDLHRLAMRDVIISTNPRLSSSSSFLAPSQSPNHKRTAQTSFQRLQLGKPTLGNAP